jgi:hypothetical protein
MQLSNVFAIFSLAVASTHATLQLSADHETGAALKEACSSMNLGTSGLDKRGCNYDDCDACYDKFQYCVACDNGAGPISCAAWYVCMLNYTLYHSDIG